ncbi:tRNA uridine-5-carboxymethylaminomethyl(34) synthesis GTPase MnmE [Fructilactobacillus lindneri]|uniref:tRNA modification GTPase MnmE n=2 Tax=Fructilactobacillus lindneri TaxID=53444 RepID=A0A0R2JUI4_9LACO|nr:tRNA uridine-5-carboxymethylaminomethyl(34) synthesis GTPase MnmE [Fructilactobacillus lindneri]ANZ57552.1 tRNA modification GTPase [Fructilactobacillus lindneri]ANZ58820.1 tRNA modification GTPase [Fructilactobacillus lindneri]KRN78263.1 tRNA modification GTPase mnmE [Fructilactobacillus lindneri DSM 20690 = JCM 11027]POG97687.1 tRNA uridine-5-carboxymethylaminomethyl(34) synthesis GTPase MnmE [Fructilactobacillus lindneri]POH00074.1 tRNA uridine-5-carboxymethylaminomethyl(34) synthesis GT
MTLITTDYDTIAAVSTPAGVGGISIVRISGSDALKIAQKIYRGKQLDQVTTDTINYGHIIDPANDNSEVDEVMVSVMRAPKTYTKEDIIEINCHGGIQVTNKVLQIVLRNGARMAEPGEFTKRAFLNGRIDLSQSEAVMDLIDAKTDEARKAALNQLDGNLSAVIKKLRQKIVDLLANVEVNIDYPEYDGAEEVTSKLMLERAREIKTDINHLLDTAQQGKVLRDGLNTAIVGRPNVGKSSLLNRLLHEEKAIVTDVPGTTRDVLDEYVNVAGVPLHLVDTAGIRDTEDKVEKIGVGRSRDAIKQSDLVLLVLNANEPLTDEDRELLDLTQNNKRIILLNKTDLDEHLDITELKQNYGASEIIKTSAIAENGTKSLEDTISKLFFTKGIASTQNDVMVTNARHISLLQQALDSVQTVIDGVESGLPVDIAQIDLHSAWDYLGEITGDSYDDELMDQLFEKFCIGK